MNWKNWTLFGSYKTWDCFLNSLTESVCQISLIGLAHLLFFRYTVIQKKMAQIIWFVTTWKVSKYGVFSGPYFPAFGLNAEIYQVNLRIQSEYRKIWTRKTSVFGHFSRGACRRVSYIILFQWSHFECFLNQNNLNAI